MSSDWIETTIGEYCPFNYGKGLHQASRKQGIVPVYGSNGRVDTHNEAYVKSPGVVVGRKGSVGKLHLSEEPFWPIDTTFYFTKDSLDELKFAFYLLKSIGLEGMNSDSAVPGLNRDNAHAIRIKIPCKKEDREAIGKFIGKLDDKIDLNRRINHTLEQIAQAIFKSWFVDFDPVKAKIEAKEKSIDPERAAMCAISGKSDEELDKLSPEQLKQLTKTAALFPDELEDSELGMIPKGWEINSIEDLSTHVAMGPFGSNIKVSTFVSSGVPVISGKHLNRTLLEDHDYNYITEKHADKLLNSNVYRGDIIFTHAGNIGQASYIPDKSKYERYILSQRQFYMRPNTTKISPLFIIYYFKSGIGQHNLLANTSQVGVPSISRPVSNLKKIKLLVPNKKVSDDFDVVIRALHSEISNNIEQSETLELVRDALLPKLLAGEISATK